MVVHTGIEKLLKIGISCMSTKPQKCKGIYWFVQNRCEMNVLVVITF